MPLFATRLSDEQRAAISRVLVVGLGSIGARHLRIARELLPEASFAALRSGTSRDDRGAAADPAVRALQTVDEAIEFGPVVAVIASPSPLHAKTAVRLASAGVHLLVEKPLASTLQSAIEIRDAVARHGVTAAVGYNLRFAPGLLALRAALGAERIGRVLSVRAEVGQYLPDWRPGRDYRGSVSAQRELGGGVLLELSHEIDYLIWLFGPVSAVHATLIRTGALEVDVEDCAHLTLRFATETRAPLHASLTMDFVRRDTSRRCTVIGENGTLEWDAVTGTVRHFSGERHLWQVLVDTPAERDATYIAEWEDLASCIACGSTPRASVDDGVRVLEVVEAATRSAFSGETIVIEAGGAGRRGAT